MKYCSQASGYYLRAVVSQMALDGGRTALASELPRQKRAAIPRRGWAPDRLSCSKTWLTKRSVDILVGAWHVCWPREGVPVEHCASFPNRLSTAFAGRGCGKRRTQGSQYSRTETVINPDLGVRRGVWNIRKLLRDGEWKDAHPMWKEADLYSQTENRIQIPPVWGREGSGI